MDRFGVQRNSWLARTRRMQSIWLSSVLRAKRNRIKSRQNAVDQFQRVSFGKYQIPMFRSHWNKPLARFHSRCSSSCSSWPLCVVYQLLFIQFKLQFILLYFRIMNLFREWKKKHVATTTKNGGNLLSGFFFFFSIVVCHFWLARSWLRNGRTHSGGSSRFVSSCKRNTAKWMQRDRWLGEHWTRS